MQPINDDILDEFPIKDLRKVADLIYFDGPLLSLFKTTNSDNYLYYWCDVDEHYNRWLIFKVSNESIDAYLTKKVSLRELVLNPLDGILYSVDIDNELNYQNICQIAPIDLPSLYLPEVDSYYEFVPIFMDENPISVNVNTEEAKDVEAATEQIEKPVNLSKTVTYVSMQNSMSAFRSLTDVLQQLREQSASILNQIAQTSISQPMISKSLLESVAVKLDFSESFSNIVKTNFDFSNIRTTFHSPAIEDIYSANLAIGNLFDSTDAIIQSAAQPLLSEQWREQFVSIQSSLGSVEELSRIVLQSHLAQISEVSLLAQSSINSILWDQLGNALNVQGNLQSELQTSFLSLSEAYSSMFRSFESNSPLILSFPPFISELPALEFFNASQLIKSITITNDEDTELAKQGQLVQREIQIETDERLSTLVAALDEDMLPLLEIDQSTSGPGYSTSFRELFNRVLRRLAPDEEIVKWSDNPTYYYNHRPTRRARLFYVTRNLNHAPFVNFFEINANSMLKFLNIFQLASSSKGNRYTPEQLQALQVREKSTLRFMLEIGSVGARFQTSEKHSKY